DRYKEAIAELQQVVAAEADHVEALNNLGVAYSRNRQIKAAIESYERAIAVRPEFAKAHHNLGMTLLQQGDFARGWAESEWRWKKEEFSHFDCPQQPRWDGTPLPAQTLLIYTEQGAGDTIQFFRYLPLAAARCQTVLLVCPQQLWRLFEAVIPPNVRLQPSGEIAVSAFAAYIPLMSLPLIFQTTLQTIPAEMPYLKAEAQQLPLPASDRPRIGVVWGGSPAHGNDRYRSVYLRDFLPVLQMQEFTFFALQKGESRLAEVAELSPGELDWTILAPKLRDFSDTAAAIAQLDLVISVDTSVAHLAGALGRPIWTLLSYYADWRWLHDRTDSPWYPSMRLFWQSQPGDWAGVMQQVREALLAQFV
ncbi:MAG: tetratricopeptide repeat protein, partial [Cyanobacteria bacterium J06641_5]